MNSKSLMKLSKWTLIVGGLLTAYQALSGVSLVDSVFGSLSTFVNLIFGLAALYLAYGLLTMKKK